MPPGTRAKQAHILGQSGRTVTPCANGLGAYVWWRTFWRCSGDGRRRCRARAAGELEARDEDGGRAYLFDREDVPFLEGRRFCSLAVATKVDQLHAILADRDPAPVGRVLDGNVQRAGFWYRHCQRAR